MCRTAKNAMRIVCSLSLLATLVGVLTAAEAAASDARIVASSDIPVAQAYAVPAAATPGCGCCSCIPNARCFGYFPTKWRAWPCEPPTLAPMGAIRTPLPAAAEPVPPPPPEPQAVPPQLDENGTMSSPTASLPTLVPPKSDAVPSRLPSQAGERLRGQNPLRAQVAAEDLSQTTSFVAPKTRPAPGTAEDTAAAGEALLDALYADRDSISPVEQCTLVSNAGTRDMSQGGGIGSSGTVDQVQHGMDAGVAAAARPLDSAAACLDGYCPVMLVDHDRWDVGNPLFRVTYQGRTYLTSGPAQQQRFMANPNRYCPALEGADPVLLADEQRIVAGRLRLSMVYGGRLYLFADAGTYDRFASNPAHYLAAVKATGSR